MNVLLVEDEPSLREGLTELLSELAQVHAAATVREAEALLAQQPFDLVLADLRIGGERSGGRKLVASARQRLSPVVVMSAMTLHEIRDELQGSPADDILCKPFQLDEVLEVVGRFAQCRRELERHAQRPEGVAGLVFEPVEPGVEMAVAERHEDREIRWYRLAPGGQVNRVSAARAHGLVVEGELDGGGVRRQPGSVFHAREGSPFSVSSVPGALNVAMVFTR
jgi:DNA-binding response OmpR family regulator